MTRVLGKIGGLNEIFTEPEIELSCLSAGFVFVATTDYYGVERGVGSGFRGLGLSSLSTPISFFSTVP
jgi:hypothetical protein